MLSFFGLSLYSNFDYPGMVKLAKLGTYHTSDTAIIVLKLSEFKQLIWSKN